LEYACENLGGLGPLVWEKIENEQTVHKGLAKLLYRLLYRFIIPRLPLTISNNDNIESDIKSANVKLACSLTTSWPTKYGQIVKEGNSETPVTVPLKLMFLHHLHVYKNEN
jgi:hypothetical protein